jgi:hypothetical protein
MALHAVHLLKKPSGRYTKSTASESHRSQFRGSRSRFQAAMASRLSQFSVVSPQPRSGHQRASQELSSRSKGTSR